MKPEFLQNRKTVLKMANKIKTKELIAHLRRHRLPELIGDECLAAFDNIEAQFGEMETYTGILEVRLGKNDPYVDYVLLNESEDIPLPSPLWYELDYEQFASGKKIEPCFFFSLDNKTEKDCQEIFDKVLPLFLGEPRAKNLRKPLEKIVSILPKKSYLKHIGTMSGRGELESARFVINFTGRENVCKFLAEMNWKGDINSLLEIIRTFNGQKELALDFDLDENGISEKIGLELTIHGFHQVIVDRYITALEKMGLCLKSKGDAIRRWIRISPDADPFIQTRFQYFKLNYLDGKIIEAKAYLEQFPYVLHHYFKNYDRPPYVDFVLKDEKNILSVGTAMKYLYDCESNRIRRVNFLGDATGYEHIDRLLGECEEAGVFSSIEISGNVSESKLEEIIDYGVNEFVTNVENISVLKKLQGLGFKNIRVKWFMDGENFRELNQKIEIAESFGVKEFVITGMKPKSKEIKKSAPSLEALEQTANFIKEYEKNSSQMKLSVESCFSVLRVFMGGEDVRKNNNRGVGCGCTAGRDHFCITATGKFSPCRFLCDEDDSGNISDYWEKSTALEKLRTMEENRQSPCKGCRYERRCLPCPAQEIANCPIAK